MEELFRGVGLPGLTIYQINPLTDGRWSELVGRHPAGSLFHTCGWLEALRRTYGFEPAALTTSAPGETLKNALVFCRVRSVVTGKRLVSLPFSDHCEPLCEDGADLKRLLDGFAARAVAERCKYAEIRPTTASAGCVAGFWSGGKYCLHRLDMRGGATGVFQGFHKDCVQRKVRRAEREGLTIAVGNSQGDVEEFYRLMIVTRRRHGLPPPSLKWFLNLADSVGEPLQVWRAGKEGRTIAAILTGRHNKTLVYKYGASDAAFHQTGGIPALFWAAIQDSVGRGMEWLDFGRSDLENAGLIEFKDRFGAERSTLEYWTTSRAAGKAALMHSWKGRLVREACARMPDEVVKTLGSVLYKHID